MSSNNNTNSRGGNKNNNNHDKYNIGARHLLQVNATIIADVLILLTIAAASDKPFTLCIIIMILFR
jgi:hypothetical protein